ncbi:Chitotriosidase-1, partial [Eschrichtius robustus]|nr:Chitotriosidase-1 [Eschrichtius robustus]
MQGPFGDMKLSQKSSKLTGLMVLLTIQWGGDSQVQRNSKHGEERKVEDFLKSFNPSYFWAYGVLCTDGAVRFLPKDVDPNLCTHLICAFAGMNNHQLSSIAWNDETLYKEFNILKKMNPKLKTLQATGGWSFGTQKFMDMVAIADNQQTFVNSAIRFLCKYGVDGLDLDWEYAGSRGSPPSDKQCFIALVQVCSWKGAAEHRIKDQKVPYAFQSNQWVGFDDVESCKIKVSYLKQTGLGGVMVWTLDMDNFAGFFCNQGRYPLIKTLRLELSEYGARAPQELRKL